MAKILCFCASNSQKSINHDLLVAACELVEGHEKTYSALRATSTCRSTRWISKPKKATPKKFRPFTN